MRAAGALALVCAAIVPGASAQPATPGPVFRVGTDLVVVDLVATDRDGRFVPDLTAADVQVLEDGRPQTVRFFQPVDRDGPAAGPATPAPASPTSAVPLRPGAATPAQGQPAGVDLVVLLDVQAMPSDVLLRARDAVERTLGDLPPEARVMLATLDHGLVIARPAVMRPDAAVAALRGLTPAEPRRSFVEFAEQVERVCAESGPEGPEARLQQAINLGRVYLDELQVQVRTATDAIAALSRLIGAADGRKHVALYSAGYPLDPVGAVRETITALCPQGRRGSEDFVVLNQVDPHALVAAAADRANRAQVSIYTVDARGLVTGTPEARQAISGRSLAAGRARTLGRADTIAAQEFLFTLAADTGGRTFLNTNDLTRGMRRAWDDGRRYYLIGYVPPAPRKAGKWHRIEVKVRRPDLDLRFRRSYQEANERGLAERDLAAALNQPAAFADETVAVEVERSGRTLRVLTFIAPSALSFSESGGLWRCDIQLDAVLRDAAGKLVGRKAFFSKRVELKLPADRFADLRSRDNIEIPTEVPVPAAGSYQLVVVVRHSAGRLVTATAAVVVE